MILPENLTVGLISHIANTNNKQPTPYLSTQEQSLSLQTPQEPTPLLTSENPKTPKPPSKPIPTHKTSSSSIHRYKTTSTKPKFTQRTSARLKAKTYTSLPPHPTLSLNTIPKKLRTKPIAHNFNVCLIPQLKSTISLLEDNVGHEIQNVAEALKSPEAEHWWVAMKSEIESINEKGTWILVPRPKDRQVITSKWLLRRKLNPDRSLHCHKARLVARGFNQVARIDFHETLSPTLIITSLRTTIGLSSCTT